MVTKIFENGLGKIMPFPVVVEDYYTMKTQIALLTHAPVSSFFEDASVKPTQVKYCLITTLISRNLPA